MEIRTIRGVEDIIPPESEKFEKIVETFKSVVRLYGFKKVILPTFEDVTLFTRSVGETTDIVQKEMYIFEDRGGRKIALRPEGTASAVRAYIQHGVHAKEPFTKWFYIGPMFRYERPQAGRNRQFYQAGCEIFGIANPGIDAELIKMAETILKKLNIKYTLEINSIGCEKCRPDYKKKLIEYLSSKRESLCEDCKNRLERNPLRVLDCKNENCKKVAENAPFITDYLCNECKTHFEKVREILESLNVNFSVNPFMVRGLDYYTKTVFEFKSKELGAQSTVLAGGRYDNLIKELGGPKTPALGFAMGIERVMLLLKNNEKNRSGVFIATFGEKAYTEGLKIAEILREKGIYTEIDHRQGSFKSQFKTANRLNMRYVIIIGDEEVENGFYSFKCLETGKQEKIESLAELIARI
ncbi:histidine--tRNA ligase [Desulfurobacterium atlanticum]|uniref:Histidine--tRNA ligase n=1 Tax=Desulfurobacterium atlanticum TaxID=240169 RepID=A0A238Y5F2_9BACT|nr:histidine--tRNA ligase [Desulfurobacterium atlanticum]SNR66327.1 histidyl-tRNA synthetase [Desulfurobacterium atlanticum]